MFNLLTFLSISYNFLSTTYPKNTVLMRRGYLYGLNCYIFLSPMPLITLASYYLLEL